MGHITDLDGPTGSFHSMKETVGTSFLNDFNNLGFAVLGMPCFVARLVLIFVRLAIFAVLLLSGFLQLVHRYFCDPRILRCVRFGPHARNFVDIYIPPEAVAAAEGRGPAVPVVIAVMGGAWTIGNRAWNVHTGLRLMDAGIITVAVDYRNFPRACIPDQAEDVHRGLSWVFENIATYGGDPTQMMLLGQSAGAHLAATALLKHSLHESSQEEAGTDSAPTEVRWSVQDLKGFLGVSGPYDLVSLEKHLEPLGLSRLLPHLCPNGDIAGCSPTRLLETTEWRAALPAVVDRLPPITLITGEKDATVPHMQSTDFAERLQNAGKSNVTAHVLPEVTHTDPVVEGPMRGEDLQVPLVLQMLLGVEEGNRKMATLRPMPQLAPSFMIKIASYVMPF
eukprot:gnl/TRDRNA2_/TRDRNA2_180095_c0_seq1.p1 gnl/TRDRNA2_/TRDRNA2_180095_c0~~gnl/TRDRNA2_/TRDRNA2_180095_c0_seq1.p1  ORF type:complete len:393 (+),score=48.90 gnl/TRDRNA2_/TRDRNA2_180095_c0_seq1:137-1315(+)